MGATMSVWRRGDAARRFDRALVAALIVLAAALVALSGSGIGAVTAPATSRVKVAGGRYVVEVRRDVAYGPVPEERLDLCQPVGARPGAPRPGVLLIHGGGWRGGARSQFAAECALLAAHGFVAATMDYRLAPRNRWPAQLVDAQLAVRYLRAQSGALGLDVARLCAWGESAGGHLAAFLGMVAGTWPGDEAGLYAGESPAVSCVVDVHGPVDLTRWLATGEQRHYAYGLFGDRQPADGMTALKAASHVFYVSAASAPTLIAQGTADTLVPASQSEELRRALGAAGVAVEYVPFAGGHNLAALSLRAQQDLTARCVAYLMVQERP